jgi:hypothetical protein
MSNIIDPKEFTKLVSYMSTFDGGLYVTNKTRKDGSRSGSNARFIMNMRKENLDYVMWVKSALEAGGLSVSIKDRKDYNTDGCNRAEQVHIESCNHPKLTTIRDRIYLPNGRKVIDPHMLKLMDAEALAIIFMADGSTQAQWRQGSINGSPSVSLNTKGFSEPENMALSKCIYDTFGIRSNINRQNQYRYLRLKTADAGKFFEIINPHVRPSFNYKFERVAPYL